MYNIKNDFNETVTLENLIYVAAGINAEATVNIDDEGTWSELNFLEDSLETIIAHLFNLNAVKDELRWEVENETDKILEMEYR